MHKLYALILLVAVAVVACDTKDPGGPANVTITGPSPFTTTTTTSTSTPSTSTTTSIPFTLSRTYIAIGPVAPNIPNLLTVSLRLISGGAAASSLQAWGDGAPRFTTAADPVFEVLGFYTTPGGAGGGVQGQLVGTLDNGQFTGTLTSITPECTAERQFGGSVNSLSLNWTGGPTLKDCKGSPLSFSSLTMLATAAPPPTAPPIPVTTTIPLSCAYGVTPTNVTFGSNGGTASVTINTGPTCAWSVQRFVDWVTVQPTAGSGPSTVSIAVPQNPGGQRTTTVVVAGQAVTITQLTTPLPSATTTSTSTSTTTTTTTTTTSINIGS